jgi:hypothetical protein
MSDRSYVYTIVHEHGFVKIGKSASPLSRRDAIQGSTPYSIQMPYVIEFTDDNLIYPNFDFEQEPQDEFAHTRTHHEWFETTADEVVDTAKQYIGDEDAPVHRIIDVQERLAKANRLGWNRSEVFR